MASLTEDLAWEKRKKKREKRSYFHDSLVL